MYSCSIATLAFKKNIILYEFDKLHLKQLGCYSGGQNCPNVLVILINCFMTG